MSTAPAYCFRGDTDAAMCINSVQAEAISLKAGGVVLPHNLFRDTMNPTKIVQVEDTFTSFVATEVESSDWFNAAKKEPGQPGVFEVNAVVVFDTEGSPRRFSYFNGKSFGPIASTPEAAYTLRFGKPALTDSITAFRGLSEPA